MELKVAASCLLREYSQAVTITEGRRGTVNSKPISAKPLKQYFQSRYVYTCQHFFNPIQMTLTGDSNFTHKTNWLEMWRVHTCIQLSTVINQFDMCENVLFKKSSISTYIISNSCLWICFPLLNPPAVSQRFHFSPPPLRLWPLCLFIFLFLSFFLIDDRNVSWTVLFLMSVVMRLQARQSEPLPRSINPIWQWQKQKFITLRSDRHTH